MEEQKRGNPIADLLALDAKYRYEGVTDDLFTLEEVLAEKPIPIEQLGPVIMSTIKFAGTPKLPARGSRNKTPSKQTKSKEAKILSPKGLLAIVKEQFLPSVKKDFWENLLIAGGSVCEVLRRYGHFADIDIFLYDLTPEEATTKLMNIYQELRKVYGKVNNVVRGDKCVTIVFDRGQEVQIILRLYNSISEILHGFDLGSSAIGFDGERVYFTSLSKFCFVNLVNIIDGTRRSTSYEHRLAKYFCRDFDIVMPNLNVAAADPNPKSRESGESTEPPERFAPNSMMWTKEQFLDDPEKVMRKWLWEPEIVDVSARFQGEPTDLRLSKQFGYMWNQYLKGIRTEIRDSYDEAKDEWKDGKDIKDTERESNRDIKLPFLTIKNAVVNNLVIKCSYVEVNNHIQTIHDYGDPAGFYAARLLNVRYCIAQLRMITGPGPIIWGTEMNDILGDKLPLAPDDVVSLYDELLASFRKGVPKLSFVQNYFIPEMATRLMENYFQDRDVAMIFGEQAQMIVKQLDKYKVPLTWMTKNVMTQLTASFNPIITDPRVWYGNLYID